MSEGLGGNEKDRERESRVSKGMKEGIEERGSGWAEMEEGWGNKRGRVRVATNMASHEFDTLVAHNASVHLHLCG